MPAGNRRGRLAPRYNERMTPQEYCQEKAPHSGSTLHYSLVFLEPPRRQAMLALHAFCRELNYVVNGTADENAARIKLAWWRHETGEMFRGQPQHMVTRALMPLLKTYDLTPSLLDQIVDGAEMDLIQTRYLDYPGLEHYSQLSSGATAECAARICGFTLSKTLDGTRDLGKAVRLASMLRDVGQDARRGRVYLPVNDLQKFEVPVADILNRRYSEQFEALMEFQYQRARDSFAKAVASIPVQDRKFQRPVLIHAALRLALLEECRAANFQVLHQRISLTPIRKLWIAWKTWVIN